MTARISFTIYTDGLGSAGSGIPTSLSFEAFSKLIGEGMALMETVDGIPGHEVTFRHGNGVDRIVWHGFCSQEKYGMMELMQPLYELLDKANPM